MCSYKLLVHKKSGYITQCKGCTNYQVAFGTTVFNLSDADFKPFCDRISVLKLITVPNGFPNQKRIRIELPCCNSTMMVLNYKELKQLYELTEEAMIMEEIDQLLNNNNLTSFS